MDNIKALFKKYKQIILYLFFGGCTTLINWVAYVLCYNLLSFENITSTVIAWVISVAFAFVTNKIWVFESAGGKNLFFEIWTFVAARLITGLLDVAVMYVAVDIMDMNANLWKLLSNIIVIVLNYIFSKFIIFKKGE